MRTVQAFLSAVVALRLQSDISTKSHNASSSVAPVSNRSGNYSVENDVPGVAVKAAFHNTWEEMYTFPERRPYVFNIVCAILCKVFGDLLVQIWENRTMGKSGLNWRRLWLFFLFGLMYVGLAQWYIFVDVFAWLLPNTIRFANEPVDMKLTDYPGQVHYFLQVMLDNFVHFVVLYIPTFYVLKEVVQGSSLLRLNTYIEGLNRYRDNITVDCLCCWMVWVPGDLIVFAVPMWLRMPVNHLISFMWTIVLSYLRGADVAAPRSAAPKRELKNDALLYMTHAV
eukprot:TRINITY_DN31746_c0_g1_i1.p1 TRINITY_DN31746_c0_g1~~TRINITY_DN31746_c0_g1_i1.p1  ORF type:complete len:282 (-),score=29.89 TRINITY_DN31746_c0_g1_i1:18-863(-)